MEDDLNNCNNSNNLFFTSLNIKENDDKNFKLDNKAKNTINYLDNLKDSFSKNFKKVFIKSKFCLNDINNTKENTKSKVLIKNNLKLDNNNNSNKENLIEENLDKLMEKYNTDSDLFTNNFAINYKNKRNDKVKSLFDNIYKTNDHIKIKINKIKMNKGIELNNYQSLLLESVKDTISNDNLRKLNAKFLDIRSKSQIAECFKYYSPSNIFDDKNNTIEDGNSFIDNNNNNNYKVHKIHIKRAKKENKRVDRLSHIIPEYLSNKLKTLKFNK